MATIIDNPNGRRSIRLSADDVLAVVSQYQQQFHGKSSESYAERFQRLQQHQYYLPEDM